MAAEGGSLEGDAVTEVAASMLLSMKALDFAAASLSSSIPRDARFFTSAAPSKRLFMLRLLPRLPRDMPRERSEGSPRVDIADRGTRRTSPKSESSWHRARV